MGFLLHGVITCFSAQRAIMISIMVIHAQSQVYHCHCPRRRDGPSIQSHDAGKIVKRKCCHALDRNVQEHYRLWVDNVSKPSLLHSL